MKISIKGLYIEATPEEVTAIFAPRGGEDAHKETAGDGEDALHIHANVFLPLEGGDIEVHADMDNQPDGGAGSEDREKPVSESDTKAGKAAEEDISKILASLAKQCCRKDGGGQNG